MGRPNMAINALVTLPIAAKSMGNFFLSWLVIRSDVWITDSQPSL